MSIIHVKPAKAGAGLTVYRGTLEARGFDPVSVEFRLWGEPPGDDAGLSEAFTIIFLPAAMRAGDDLTVRGPLDPWFLYHVGELTAFWNRMRPKRFRRIGVAAEEHRNSGQLPSAR